MRHGIPYVGISNSKFTIRKATKNLTHFYLRACVHAWVGACVRVLVLSLSLCWCTVYIGIFYRRSSLTGTRLLYQSSCASKRECAATCLEVQECRHFVFERVRNTCLLVQEDLGATPTWTHGCASPYTCYTLRWLGTPGSFMEFLWLQTLTDNPFIPFHYQSRWFIKWSGDPIFMLKLSMSY